MAGRIKCLFFAIVLVTVSVNCEDLLSAYNGYYYKPPEEIVYTGTSAEIFKNGTYPAYNESKIPQYIFEYRTSSNKYRKLLAGLALYNLAELSPNVTFDSELKHKHIHKKTRCKFSVFYPQKQPDEMQIDCEAMSNINISELNPLPKKATNTLKNMDDTQFDGLPVDVAMAKCYVEGNKSAEIPCHLLELYEELSLFAISQNKTFNKILGYTYEPPQSINYAGSRTLKEYTKGKYPVYKPGIPKFIFEYRTSKNKYRKLLAGMALYNLAVISYSNSSVQSFHDEFKGRENAQCAFSALDQEIDPNKYDEMEVKCETISSFILDSFGAKSYPTATAATAGNAGNISSITDSQFNGEPVNTASLECFVESKYKIDSTFITKVPCDLFALYSDMSFSTATISKPTYFILLVVTMLFFY